MLEQVPEWAVAALTSGAISTFVLGYLKRYLDKKLDAVEEEKRQKEAYQRHRNVATAKLRRATGRLLFWLHHAITKPPPNGELEAAFEAYQKAEDDLKGIDQEIVADYETES